MPTPLDLFRPGASPAPIRRLRSAGLAALAIAAAAGVPVAALQAPVPVTSLTWDQLDERPIPAWFTDARLGIFIHWGVYSVPSFSGPEQYAEWFLRGLMLGDTLRTRFMAEAFPEVGEYRDFAPHFRARLFEPAEWADLFRRAGAGYVVLVSKHHDGFALWPSPQSPGWNAVDVGPGRDLVGELTEAVRAEGLRMGLYYSLGEWTHPLYRWETDPAEAADRYVEEHMLPQLVDLVERYRPSLLFGDGDWGNSAERWRTRDFLAWYFERMGPEAVANDRWGGGSRGGFLTPEYSAGLVASDRPWAEVRGLGRSFGLNRNERLEAYMSPEALVRFFARAVAAGGGMILNVGPTADGQIPLIQQERLLQLGAWIDLNGEAIRGSEPWVRLGEEVEVEVRRIDPVVAFDWVRNSPDPALREDEFSAEWRGWLTARRTGVHRLTLAADDRARLWIDGEPLLDTDGGPASDTVLLTEGEAREIRIFFEEERQNASVRWSWTPPGAPEEVVPADALAVSPNAEADRGLQARYRSLRESLVYTRTGSALNAIAFQWPDSVLALPLERPAGDMTVRLLGREGDLPWSWADGSLTIDVSSLPFSEIPGRWAWTFRLEGYLPP